MSKSLFLSVLKYFSQGVMFLVTNSIAFASKLIIFLDLDVSQLDSSTLQEFFNNERQKHERGFSSVVFCGSGKTSKSFYLQ